MFYWKPLIAIASLFVWAICPIQGSAFALAGDDGLLSIFSDSDAPSSNDFSFTTNTETDLSGSQWGFFVNENDVYHAALRHRDNSGDASQDWDIRIGSGGQIYSIRGSEVGEIVPPQSLGRPFMDEVFQSISVDRSTQNAAGGQPAFYHQSGYYVDGNNVSQPTYSPLLASGAVDSNSYSTLSLAVQADTESNPQQPGGLLNYQRTRDLGGGVIEVTHSIYNFGNHTVDFHNLPWGGVRKTTFDNMLVSNPDGGFTDRAILGFGDFENQVVSAEATGGWAAYAEGTDGSDQGIAYVFGNEDTHLGEDWQTEESSWRWGDGGGDIIGLPVRNFNVGTFRREVDVNPGDLFESRYFLVLGDVDHIEDTIADRELVDAAVYDKILVDEADASQLSWRIVSDGDSISVLESTAEDLSNFKTYTKPVNGSVPLLLLEDADGRQFLSVDPYALSATPYDGETTYKGILGFVLPEDVATGDGPYVDLATLFPNSFYIDTNSDVQVFALQGSVAVPEPSGIALLILCGSCLLRRRVRNTNATRL